MPVSIPYTYTQSSTTITLDIQLPISASHNATATPDLVVTPLFIKLSAPPALLTVDLAHSILPHTATLKKQPAHSSGHRPHFTLVCTKEEAGEWQALEWTGSKEEREARRRQCMQWWEVDEEKRRHEKSEQRRLERKEDREKGWEWQRQQKGDIAAAKRAERVVALDDLRSWQQQQHTQPKREVWEAKTGETIEVIEDDEHEIQNQSKQEQEQKAEECKYPADDDNNKPTPKHVTPPAVTARPSVPPPPVRSTTRLTTTFTAVHPTLPSLPARESNPIKADITAPATDVSASLLQLKDKADSYYKRRDVQSAITAYTQLLDDKEVRQRGSGGGGSGEWRYGWVVARVLSNRSACYLALAQRAGVAALAQQLLNVQRAEDDAIEALSVLSALNSSTDSTDQDKTALQQKLHKRLVTLYSLQGRWEQALTSAETAELKEEMTEVSSKVEAVRRGDDVTAQREAEQLLSHKPPLLSAALRCVNTALSLSPLSLTSLQLRLDVCGRLGEWEKALRDAVLGVSLCERSQQHSQQRVWWIGRRGECYLALKQFTAAQADIGLLSAASTLYTPLTASSLPALLASTSHQQRLHTLLSSLAPLRAASSYEQLKTAFSSLLSLSQSPQSPTATSTAEGAEGAESGLAADEWMVSRLEWMSEQAWCELKLHQYTAAIARCQRVQQLWQQWIDRPKQRPSQREVSEVVDESAGGQEEADVKEEKERLQVLECERRDKLARRVYRWRILTSVRLATAICFMGRLTDGRDEYKRVLHAMGERRADSGGVESEEESCERVEVEADLAKIDAALVEQSRQA